MFEGLDRCEQILGTQRFLCGATLTEADIRLFVTIVRFDEVYHGHFKCNVQRVEDYPNVSNYMRDIYQMPGIAATVDMWHIKQHYHCSHPNINPYGIVPKGPGFDLNRPHDRNRF